MKWKKIKKIKSINYFYIFFQTHLTYSNFSIIKLNNLKIYKFLTNFNYILFSFIIFIYSIIKYQCFPNRTDAWTRKVTDSQFMVH